jgi:hypothetical protein
MPGLPTQEVSNYIERWRTIGAKGSRSAVAKSLGVVASNLDSTAGLTRPPGTTPPLYRLLPTGTTRTTAASREFDTAMLRYDTITKFANDAASTRPKVPRAEVTHLRQAALVLAIGSFDAYVRSVVIERYLAMRFAATVTPGKAHTAWNDAVLRAVKEDPELLTKVASMSPAQAERLLAESVFAIENVRILTSSFETASANLKRIDVDIEVHENSTTTKLSEQFLQIAWATFNAFASTRHLVMHVGGSTSRSELYCLQQEPERYLGSFLRGLVTSVEGKL